LVTVRLFAVMLILVGSSLGLAQNVPATPNNPINFLIKSLQNEAGLNLRGTVQENVIFPPRKEPVQTKDSLPAPAPINANLLRQNFNSSIAAGEPIAGRSTWKIVLTPNNRDAATFTYWIDREWHVRLAVEERDFDNAVTAQARFTKLEGSPTARNDGRKLGKFEFKPKLEAFLQNTVGNLLLPDGFRMFVLKTRTVGKDNLPALELRASNGLSVLVIVFSPIGTRNTPKLATHKLITRGNEAWIWAIGNLPEAQLQRTANSINMSLDLNDLLVKFNEQAPK
jgi:negative regulator of sigma E activity